MVRVALERGRDGDRQVGSGLAGVGLGGLLDRGWVGRHRLAQRAVGQIGEDKEKEFGEHQIPGVRTPFHKLSSARREARSASSAGFVTR